MPLKALGRNERGRPVFAFPAFLFSHLNSRFFELFDLSFLLSQDCDQSAALYSKNFITGDVDRKTFVQAGDDLEHVPVLRHMEIGDLQLLSVAKIKFLDLGDTGVEARNFLKQTRGLAAVCLQGDRMFQGYEFKFSSPAHDRPYGNSACRRASLSTKVERSCIPWAI